ncbi:MAG: hypothetical protein AB8G05_01560 [Oligoflexales bacterium]
MFNFFIVTSAFILTSCSTMFNSGTQSMQIVTSDGEKHKADIRTPSGSYSTEVPTTVTASPSSFNDVEISIQSSDCYNPTSIKVGKTIAASYWANIFNGYGFLIDPLTGAMWNYDNISTLTVSKKDGCKEKDKKKKE